MAEAEKSNVIEHHEGRPEHLEELNQTRKEVDVVHVTTENPYKEINFIGTYIAIALACDAAFAGFVMPATALAIIVSYAKWPGIRQS